MNILVNNQFKIAIKAKELLLKYDNILINVPKSDLIYKEKIISNGLSILNKIYEIDIYKDKEERNKLLKELIVYIEVQDFYLERLWIRKYISKAALDRIIGILLEIKKMTIVLVKNTKEGGN